MVLGIADEFQRRGPDHLLPQPRRGRDRGLEGLRPRVHAAAQDPLAALRDLRLAEEARRRSSKRAPFGFPLVVKADGLAAGKGTLVVEDAAEAQAAVGRDDDGQEVRHAPGAKLVMEEFLPGEEVSFLVFSDGARVVPMVSVQDHKRVARRRHRARTPAAWARSRPSTNLSLDMHKQIMQEIVLPTIGGHGRGGPQVPGRALRRADDHRRRARRCSSSTRASATPRRRSSWRACARTSCPSCRAWPTGTSRRRKIDWAKEPAVCVVLAASGYPGRAGDGQGDPRPRRPQGPRPTSIVYHAATAPSATARSSPWAAACWA